MRERLGVLLAVADHWRLTTLYLAAAVVFAVLLEVVR